MHWIDRTFFILQLKSRIVAYRYSQKIGLILENSVLALHHAFLRQTSKNLNIEDEAFFSRCVDGSPRIIPRYPSFYLNSDEQLMRENLENEKLIIEGHAHSLEDLSWIQDPFPKKSALARLLFHSLDPARQLLDVHHSKANPKCIQLALSLARNWINECLHSCSLDNIWSDHATAFRAIVFCQIWEIFRETQSQDVELGKSILEAITRHGEILAENWFYRPEHDHGVTQAYALLSLGLLFPQLPSSSKWVELGALRLERQMKESVSSEGLHREHSPYYHFLVFRQFFYAYELGKELSFCFSEQFLNYLMDMLHVGSYLIAPNGQMTALGDSNWNSPILIESFERTRWPVSHAHEFLYSTSGGQEGKRPNNRSAIYADGGLAVMRSGWGASEPFEMERYLSVRLGTFEAPHVHQDIGSFEFYAYGEMLVVDSGGPFSYGHPMRSEYFLASKAHNTIAIGGQAQRILQSHVLAWESNASFDHLWFEHWAYGDILHKRRLLFVQGEYLVIFDEIIGEVFNDVSQLFHLNESLELRVKNMTVLAEQSKGGPALQVIPLELDDLRLKTYRGAESPWQGWRCGGEEKGIQNGVIEYCRSGMVVRFVTLVLPEKTNVLRQVTSQCQWSESDETYDIKLEIGDKAHHLALHPSLPPRVISL